MLDIRLGNLVGIKNNSALSVCGIAPKEARIVFLDPYWAISSIPEAVEKLSSGEFIGFDVSEQSLPAQVAVSHLLELAAKGDTLINDLSVARTEQAKRIVRVGWNVLSAGVVVATVRAEMIAGTLLALGVDPLAELSKFQPVLSLTLVGMFAEASQLLGALPTDAFLTEARRSRYQRMLLSADAIR